MQKLIELSHLVTGVISEKNLRTLFKDNQTDPKAYVLLNGIITGRYKTDAQAAFDLYNQTASAKNYLMLKGRVKNKLLSLVFSMDLSKRIRSNYVKMNHACNKKLFAARQLIMLGYRNVVIEVVKDAFKTAQKYHFTEMQLASARLLRDHEVFTGSRKKAIEYDGIIELLSRTFSTELEIENCFQTIRLHFRTSAVASKEVLALASYYYQSANTQYKKTFAKTNGMTGNIFRIAIYYHHLKNDHNKVLEACSKFEEYLEKNPLFNDLGVIAEINMQKLDTSLYLKKYEAGKASAAKCLSIFKKGISNWIVVNELYFLLCLQTGKYEEAKKILHEVKSDAVLKNASDDRIERWKIFEAFLYYTLPESPNQKKININKFVNEVPVFSKDKTGFNLSIIVAQILLLVKLGDFDKVMDKYESLKSYSQRNVKADQNPRSFYFIKMLLTMIRNDFDFEKTENAASKYFDKLVESTIGKHGKLETLEVIPYDVLWPSLLEHLKLFGKEKIERMN